MLGSKAAGERFAALVRQLVEEEGSRAAVARMLDLNASYISKVVRGEVHGVRESTLRDVAARLGIDAAFFEAPAVNLSEWRTWRGGNPPQTREERLSEAGSLGELVRALDQEMRSGQRPSPDRFREAARMFLGSLAVTLAKHVRDEPVDQTVARIGPAFVESLLTMLTWRRAQSWSVARSENDTSGDRNG
ncbi:MAG: transcriptional regulator [Sandaracinus sp.]|nr:transcriptional regulator [Sandaracinus sp.]